MDALQEPAVGDADGREPNPNGRGIPSLLSIVAAVVALASTMSDLTAEPGRLAWIRIVLAGLAVFLLAFVLISQLLQDVVAIVGRLACRRWPPGCSVARVPIIVTAVMLAATDAWPYGRPAFWPFAAMFLIYCFRFVISFPLRNSARRSSPWFVRNELDRSCPGIALDLAATFVARDRTETLTDVWSERALDRHVYNRLALATMAICAVILVNSPENEVVIESVADAVRLEKKAEPIGEPIDTVRRGRSPYDHIDGDREDVCKDEPDVRDVLPNGSTMTDAQVEVVTKALMSVDPNDFGCLVGAIPMGDGFALRVQHPQNDTAFYDGLVIWHVGRAAVVYWPFVEFLDREIRRGGIIEWVLDRSDTEKDGYLQAVGIDGTCVVMVLPAGAEEAHVMSPELSSVAIETAATHNLVILDAWDTPDGFALSMAERDGGPIEYSVTQSATGWEVDRTHGIHPPIRERAPVASCNEGQANIYAINAE